MVVVGTRLGDDVDDAGAGAAHFTGEFVGCNLEFLDAVLWEVHQCAANNLIVVVAAVDGNIAAAAEGSRR